jgi:hypothetical protein
MLFTFLILYLLASIAVGLWFARRVKNTEDFNCGKASSDKNVDHVPDICYYCCRRHRHVA